MAIFVLQVVIFTSLSNELCCSLLMKLVTRLKEMNVTFGRRVYYHIFPGKLSYHEFLSLSLWNLLASINCKCNYVKLFV